MSVRLQQRTCQQLTAWQQDRPRIVRPDRLYPQIPTIGTHSLGTLAVVVSPTHMVAFCSVDEAAPGTSTTPWVMQGGTVFSGSWAAASAENLPDGGISTLSLRRNNCSTGWVVFRLAVSSEADADWLRFYLDDVEQKAWSGEVNWLEYAVAVDAGAHTFTWEYSKDVSGAAGDDRAYVDDVELPAPLEVNAPIYG